jgi:hypothetical protein
MIVSFGLTRCLPLRQRVVSAQAAFRMRVRLVDLAGMTGKGARRRMKLRWNTYACFKRLFESYTKIPAMCKRWPGKSGTAAGPAVAVCSSRRLELSDFMRAGVRTIPAGLGTVEMDV